VLAAGERLECGRLRAIGASPSPATGGGRWASRRGEAARLFDGGLRHYDLEVRRGGLIVCWGEVLWDLFPDAPCLGGAPANVAYHLAKLGRRVALVSRVGDDELGRRALSRMKAAGINVDAVEVDARRPTGRVEVTLAGGEPSYTLVPGCAWEAIALGGQARALVEQAAVLYFGTLSQRSHAGRVVFEQALAAVPSGCLKVCDPNLRPRHLDEPALVSALTAADVVKVNESEANILAKRFATGDPVDWLFREARVRLVALTRGHRGSAIYSEEGCHEHPGFPAKPGGDNVGAGDAFVAALTDRTLTGQDLGTCNVAANRYASFVASRKGATPDIPQTLLDELDASE
jgi:fructokinase